MFEFARHRNDRTKGKPRAFRDVQQRSRPVALIEQPQHRVFTIGQRLAARWCSLFASGVDLWVEGADERQVTVPLRVVEAITDDELVGNVEADIPDRHVDLDRVGLAALR